MKPYLWVAQATGTAVPCPYILVSSREIYSRLGFLVILWIARSLWLM